MGRQDKASGKKKTTLGREGIIKINSRELSILKNQQYLHYVSIQFLAVILPRVFTGQLSSLLNHR